MVDAEMPGTTGLDALSKVRRLRIMIPGIAITTGLGPKIRAAAERAGATLLEKPLAPGALVSLVEKFLDRREI